MLGWRSSGLSPAPSAGGAASVVNGDSRKTSSAAEERAEAEQHGGRVGRDLAQPAAREEQDRAAPQREQQHPQQQRALLRRPHRGQPVEQRRRRGRVARDEREREVRADERRLQDRHRHDQQPGERVDGAAAGGDVLAPAGARAVERGADAVDADRQRGDQAEEAGERHGPAQVLGSAENFDGHLVTSESGWPSNTAPCLRTSIDDLAPLAERVGDLTRRSGPGRSPRRPSDPRRGTCGPCPSCFQLPAATLPVSW